MTQRRHIDDTDVVAGLDELAGGTWMGLNDSGVVACILNRHGFLGPAPHKRSRGELVLEALDHADADAAAQALSDVDPAAPHVVRSSSRRPLGPAASE